MARRAQALVAGAMIAAAGSSVPAQDCVWNPIYSNYSGSTGPLVYDAALGKLLMIESNSVSRVSIAAWDGANWTVLDSSGPQRVGGGVAYDPVRDRLVYFGGVTGIYQYTYFGDTWEWDGHAWSQVATTGPSPRTAAAMAYDDRRHCIVLFGGYSGSGFLGDTWTFDGQTWVNVANSGPSPRSAWCTAFDSVHGRFVIYGGRSYTPPYSYNDLWEWDGTTWSQGPGLPDYNSLYWMFFDAADARLVLGRQNPTHYFSVETQEFDTNTRQWSLRVPGNSPEGPAAYDAGRSLGVSLYGTSVYEYNRAGTGIPPSIVDQPNSGQYVTGSDVMVRVRSYGENLAFQWYRDGIPLADGGRISGATTYRLTISHAQVSDSGGYLVSISNPCGSTDSDYAFVDVADSFCYPNCDHSTTPPYLNVNDFVCFMTAFARGDPYANCDHGYTPPVLNVNDFICFQARFVAGCSAP